MANKSYIKDVIFGQLVGDDEEYSCLSSVTRHHFPVIESPNVEILDL